MKEFKIPVSWTMVADMKVQAHSLDEAISKVEATPGFPANGEYLDDSFEVNKESAAAANEEPNG